jgi:V/A-type H+-transporting ATPase subunit D
MTRLALNKAELQRQKRSLADYRQFLPSLDLKRRQLLADRGRARVELAAARAALEEVESSIGAELPMLADERVDLDGLVTVEDVVVETENLLGLRLPRLGAVDVRVAPYSKLGRPHWVDRLAERLREAVLRRYRLEIAEERLRRLERAVTTITQRVNLFEKVLIPQAEQTVRRIGLHLSDAERAAVVRAKIAKSRIDRVRA